MAEFQCPNCQRILTVSLGAAPPPSSLPAAAPFFATEGSPWRTPLPAAAPIASNNSAILASLDATRRATGRGIWIESGNYSCHIYVVPGSTPRVPMYLQNLSLTGDEVPVKDGTARQHLAWQLQQGVPLTDDMRAVNGTDGHMTVVDGSTGEMWDLITVWRDGGVFPWSANWGSPSYRDAHWGTGTWRCWWGGYLPDHRQNIGQFRDVTTTPRQYRDWGSTATSLPVAAGMVLESEMQAGEIPHALQMAIPNPLEGYVWPAQRGDGYPASSSTWVNQGLTPTVKEGTTLRLKASVSDTVTSGYGAAFDANLKTLRVALKRFGAIVNDRTGNAIMFRVEPSRAMYERFNPGGWDPWPMPYSDALLAIGLPAFTPDNWEVIDPSYRPGGTAAVTVLESFHDQFAAPLASPPWDLTAVTADVSVTNGQLRITTTSAYTKLKTTPAKMAGSSFSAQVVSGPAGNGADQFGVGVQSPSNANCRFELRVNNGTLTASYKAPNGTQIDHVISTYGPAHKWFRVRQAGSSVFWETSADGTTWTTGFSESLTTTGWDITAFDEMVGMLWSGNYNNVVSRPPLIVESI